jgi:hypothetical protein
MVSKGNHPQMALIQISELLQLAQMNPSFSEKLDLDYKSTSWSNPHDIFRGETPWSDLFL